MFTRVASFASLLSTVLALRVLGQAQEPAVVTAEDGAEAEQARARLLADPEIAPLHEKLLATNARLHAAREALLRKDPVLVEKQAKLQGLLTQLSVLGTNKELADADRATQRRAIMAELAPLSQAIAESRRSLTLDEQTAAIRQQAESLEKELEAAIGARLAAEAAAKTAAPTATQTADKADGAAAIAPGAADGATMALPTPAVPATQSTP